MKVYLDTVGCRLNQSEIETFALQFRAAGHELVADPSEADMAVVNTCSVTAAAAADSRKMIRRLASKGAGQVVATGCWTTLNPAEAAALPGVTSVFSNEHKERLVPEILNVAIEDFDLEPLAREPIPGARLRTRVFIKVQDGCDNRCTCCVTTLARGPGRSRSLADVLLDIQSAVRGGAQEVVLTGVHLGSWGSDMAHKRPLADLIRTILDESAAPRLRLSSLEPWDLQPEFFRLWENPRLCRHLHLPLQSGCDATLRRMARRTTRRSFAALVAAARQAVPEIAITTDVIVGFPGETEAEFAESLEFVKAMNFAGGHVFTYSSREGTAAARMPAHVPHGVRKQRNAQARTILKESSLTYRRQFIGQQIEVLWESATAMGPDFWELSGLTDNYIRVSARAPRHVWNSITPVRLETLTPTGAVGVLDWARVK